MLIGKFESANSYLKKYTSEILICERKFVNISLKVNQNNTNKTIIVQMKDNISGTFIHH
jgi:hypothetical protein